MAIRISFILILLILPFVSNAQERGFLFGLEGAVHITKTETVDPEGNTQGRSEQQLYLGGFNVGYQWNDKHAILLGYRIGEQSEYWESKEQMISSYYYDPNVINLTVRYRNKQGFGNSRFGVYNDLGYRYTHATTGRIYLNAENVDLSAASREIKQKAHTLYYTPRFYFKIGKRFFFDVALLSLEGQSRQTAQTGIKTVHDQHIKVNFKRPTIGLHCFLPLPIKD